MDRQRLIRILNSPYPIFREKHGQLLLDVRRVIEKNNNSVYRVSLGVPRKPQDWDIPGVVSYNSIIEIEEVTAENVADRAEEILLHIAVAESLFGWM